MAKLTHEGKAVTKEDDFQRILDEKPDDWHTRMVFADWLEERGDPRAAGYRAIAVQQRRPLTGHITLKKKQQPTWWWHCPEPEYLYEFHNHLPRDWFDLLPAKEGNLPPGKEENSQYWPVHSATGGLKSRRGCEDALAVAFTKLSPDRQAELLVPPAALNPAPAKRAGKKKASAKKKPTKVTKKATKPKSARAAKPTKVAKSTASKKPARKKK